jgi:hypothetical protein
MNMLKESEYRGHNLGGNAEKKLEDGPVEEAPRREVKE